MGKAEEIKSYLSVKSLSTETVTKQDEEESDQYLGMDVGLGVHSRWHKGRESYASVSNITQTLIWRHIFNLNNVIKLLFAGLHSSCTCLITNCTVPFPKGCILVCYS